MKTQKKPVWITDKGRELIALEGATGYAKVVISTVDAEELEELAEACVEAAQALRERTEESALANGQEKRNP
jgi:hypothetical protein